MNQYFKTNQELWDQKTEYHKNSEFYDLEAFKKGKSSLKEIELQGVGQVQNKSLLHLQCHFGQDTLSWARMGAEVTGVDLSGEAINLANELSEELSIPGTFIQSNLYDLYDKLDKNFDIIFTSYGTIVWLPDLNKWAKLINHYLKKGGFFYIADFHPIVNMLDYDNNLSLIYPYFNTGKAFEDVVEGTYADRNAPIKHKEYFWFHSFSEILTALLNEGLTIEAFNEFDYSPYNCFPGMTEISPGKYRLGNPDLALPHVFSIRVRK